MKKSRKSSKKALRTPESSEEGLGATVGAGEGLVPVFWASSLVCRNRIIFPSSLSKNRHRCGGTPGTPDPSLTGTQVSVECDRCRDVVSFVLLEEEARKGEFFGRKSARVRMVCARHCQESAEKSAVL